MIKKFEIKSHDGPARLGKLEGSNTPKLFDRKDMNIAPTLGSSYNIDKEIAQLNVRKTLENGRENVEKCDFAVIQGSKYLDLRLECAKELEKIGYNCLLIANSDELLLHPRDLVELVVKTRKILNPNTVLIFTFAEPSFMPLLSYMGIDGFLKDSANYYSYLNDFMTPTKTYDLDEYSLFDEISRNQLEENNLKTLEFVIREIQTHIKNNSLRNLVEERSLTTPQNVSALKILDKKYMKYLLENTQLY